MGVNLLGRQVEYRSDIDILRCLAILSVLLYHFRVEPFFGGFIGVDIFFVISGYLITSIILKDASKGAFSFSSFYGRRTRRLVPALLATIFLCFLTSYFVFFPEDFARQSRATVFTLIGASNFLFWMESGYFDVDSVRKALLHSWSLSVEFQFYALWPPFIWFLAKVKREAAIIAVAAATLISFLACVYIMTVDATAGFFLVPFRMWEFAVGGLVFFLERRRLQYGPALEALYLVGLVLIVACVVGYHKDIPFPGWTALPPVLGTALMIYAGRGTVAPAFLDRRLPRFIGQISYSLYLVHWPILVFALYLFGPIPQPLQTVALLSLTFVMAVLMFRLVESPFRSAKMRAVSPIAFNATCAALIACIMAPAAYAWTTNGLWAWRLAGSDVIKKINAYDVEAAKVYVWSNYNRLEVAEDFRTTKRRILVVGDSQAADILNMFIEAGLDKNVEIVARKIHYECGLPYLPEREREYFWSHQDPMTMKMPGMPELCRPLMDRLVSSPALKNADVVIVAFLWQDFALSLLRESLDAISKRTKNGIWVVGSKTFRASSVRMANDLGEIAGIERYAADLIPRETSDLNQLLRETYGPRFVDILSAICPSKNKCLVLTGNNKPVFFDPAHFTREGADFIWNQGASRLFEFVNQQ